ncbi:uncharacterized protein [Diadema setosum]|uniref:uncharacterized protein n=1 Tax=Diadema setosum TaxID=31175 RepID=UPI003B3BAAE9
MSLIPEFLEDLLPSGSLTDHALFTTTPSSHSMAAGCHVINLDHQSKGTLRKKEYFRQLFTFADTNQSLVQADLHLLTGDDIRLLKMGEVKKYERRLRQKVLGEKAVVEEMISSHFSRQKRQRRRREVCRDKTLLNLKKRLSEERKKNRQLREDLRVAKERSSVLEREKNGEQTKVEKLSGMVRRMRSTLLEMENDLTLYRSELTDKEEHITSLEDSLAQATDLRNKLETEFNRVLEESADDDFKHLTGSQLAMLRKTTPCNDIDVGEKYEPVVDDQNFLVTLGSGNFGTVMAYREREEFGNKSVAVKVLNDGDNDDDEGDFKEQVRQEVLLEARLLKLFFGTGVFPRVFGVGTVQVDRTAIVMEFLGDDETYDVITLKSWTSSEHADQITLGQAASVFLDIIEGVKAMHAMDILHNDIKDDNVIVKKTGVDTFQGFLIDLGSASTTYLPASYAFQQDQLETYREDPLAIHYAPELILDGALTSVATDVYQIGRVIFMTGEELEIQALMDIGEKCLCRKPRVRLKLDEVYELMVQMT